MWPRQYIVPVVRYLGAREDGLEIAGMYGSAFFINAVGGFMTAKHVMESVICAVQKEGGQAALLRTTLQASSEVCPILEHDFAPKPFDIAVGRVRPPTSGCASAGGIGNLPGLGDEVSVIGYPEYSQPALPMRFQQNLFRPTQFRGIVSAVGSPRTNDPMDPVLEFSFDVPPGVSGSPVFAGGVISIPPILVGVCIANERSEYTLEISREEETAGGAKSITRTVHAHTRGYAHKVVHLLSTWRPACFSHSLLGGEIWVGPGRGLPG